MIGLALLLASIALVDSLNPTTVISALYLATATKPVRGVLGFAAGFFAVNLVGGIVGLVAGERIASLVPRPTPLVLHTSEIALGLAALVGGWVIWRRRQQVGATFSRSEGAVGRVAPIAGATLAAVELPTALPYFAAIAAMAGSDQSITVQIVLLVGFNVLYLAPVLAIAGLRAIAGRRAVEMLERVRGLFLRHAGGALAGLLGAIGVALLTLGAVGTFGSR